MMCLLILLKMGQLSMVRVMFAMIFTRMKLEAQVDVRMRVLGAQNVKLTESYENLVSIPKCRYLSHALQCTRFASRSSLWAV